MTQEKLNLSSIVHGHWRLGDWNLSNQELLSLTKECIDLGITSFDHADIYGNYSCESIFGKALALDPSLRNQIQIVSKCGIKLDSDKFPERKLKVYDYSFDYIMNSVNQSLKNLRTDYLDLLLLHRPSPFFDPSEVSRAFEELYKSGKVKQFGVSNFNPLQFEMLQKNCSVNLVTNQVELSTYCLEHFENGNMDFFMKERIRPMAWSPLAGGMIFKPQNPKADRVRRALIEVSQELNLDSIDTLAYAWILKHPIQAIPIVGSGKLSRIKTAVEAFKIDLNLEQWFKIYIAAKGEELP